MDPPYFLLQSNLDLSNFIILPCNFSLPASQSNFTVCTTSASTAVNTLVKSLYCCSAILSYQKHIFVFIVILIVVENYFISR